MKVLFIPKMGKDDCSVPKVYRPITLSNFLLKVMEGDIHWFLGKRVVALPLPKQEAHDAAGSTPMITGWYNKVLTRCLVSADLQGANNTIVPSMSSPQGGNPIAAGVELGNELPAINLPSGGCQGKKICGQHYTYCQRG